MNFYLLGIKIDILSKEDIGNFLRETLMQKTQHHVVTLNPEMVMWAQKDIEFKNVINDAGLRTIDGVGIVQAARLRGKKAERHTGYDLTLQVLRIAEEEEKSVFFSRR